MARTARSTPAELAPAPWPDKHSSDPSAEVARQFVLNLHDAMEGRPLRAVAGDAGIHHVTLLKILHGRAWPDLATISRLEIGLNADLYPSRAPLRKPGGSRSKPSRAAE
jgi:transcriptional regulator with XRE-family HTH domain